MTTINLKQTAFGLDPNETTANPEASLTAWVAEATEALEGRFPGVVVTHQEIDDTYSFICSDDEITAEVQDVLEAVYETGNFWC